MGERLTVLQLMLLADTTLSGRVITCPFTSADMRLLITCGTSARKESHL